VFTPSDTRPTCAEAGPVPEGPAADAEAGAIAVTDRILLRPLVDADLDWYTEAIGGDAEAAARELADDRAHRSAHGFGHLVGTLRRGGERAVVVELHHAHPGVEGIRPDEIEIGWVTHPAWRGRGLATEAVRAAAAQAISGAAIDHLVAYVRPENVASLRVAGKVGMRERGPGRTRSGDPCVILELRANGG
jgi:RimJ/RimL family protein N-acetyltransferase